LLEKSLAEARRLDSDQHIGNALCDLGVLALYDRRYEDALELFAGSLESALRTGWRINVVYTLRGIAGGLCARGDVETAARLLGAAGVMQEQIAEELQSYSIQAYAETAAPVTERLDEPDIAAAFAAGKAMSPQDAAQLALDAVGRKAPL
jgi:hypothetical protein